MVDLTPSSTTAQDILAAPESNNSSFILAADELKDQGNVYFRSSQWNEALVAYQSALGHLPKRTSQPEKTGNPEGDETVVQDVSVNNDQAPTQLDAIARRRAVLNANIGACFVKLAEHKQAVDACSQALLDDPQYVKALQRRAASNETIGSWSSLTAAQEDYHTLIKLLPQSSSQLRDVQRLQELLKPRLESAQKRETAEMLDKLKGLGNSILGNFGLSTDNFKFEPNGQGGYSLNFQK